MIASTEKNAAPDSSSSPIDRSDFGLNLCRLMDPAVPAGPLAAGAAYCAHESMPQPCTDAETRGIRAMARGRATATPRVEICWTDLDALAPLVRHCRNLEGIEEIERAERFRFALERSR